jgi:hypothetical protein
MGVLSLTASTVQGMNAAPGSAAAAKELVRKGVFDDNPELKRIVEETIRASEEESRKAPAKRPAESKPGQ